MKVKIAFVTTLWLILAAMLFISPDFAGASGLISVCILGGAILGISSAETEEDKVILSWVGIASSSILLLIVVYWGLIQ